MGQPAPAIPFRFDPFVPARDERRPRPVLPPGEWVSGVAAAGEDDISLREFNVEGGNNDDSDYMPLFIQFHCKTGDLVDKFCWPLYLKIYIL